MKVTSI